MRQAPVSPILPQVPEETGVPERLIAATLRAALRALPRRRPAELREQAGEESFRGHRPREVPCRE